MRIIKQPGVEDSGVVTGIIEAFHQTICELVRVSGKPVSELRVVVCITFGSVMIALAEDETRRSFVRDHLSTIPVGPAGGVPEKFRSDMLEQYEAVLSEPNDGLLATLVIIIEPGRFHLGRVRVSVDGAGLPS
jgi:hypothetical protein